MKGHVNLCYRGQHTDPALLLLLLLLCFLQFMGVVIGSAVIPIAFSITWAKCSAFGAIAGAVGGLIGAIITWLVTAKVRQQQQVHCGCVAVPWRASHCLELSCAIALHSGCR